MMLLKQCYELTDNANSFTFATENLPPQSLQRCRYFKVGKIFASYSDVLEFGHELAVETAHGVSSQESVAFVLEVGVYLCQLGHQRIFTIFIFLYQHQLELAVHILDYSSHFFILRNRNVSFKIFQQ